PTLTRNQYFQRRRGRGDFKLTISCMTVIFQDMSPLSTPDLPRFFLGASAWSQYKAEARHGYENTVVRMNNGMEIKPK
ncbi:MAG: hypothetical protein QNJ41_26315, partial [Xenococcaceae cyanobacterium MO_188.B32]|nr:hypothetical protein [Xenococcaceae cyanobacterium MO_188.B32]